MSSTRKRRVFPFTSVIGQEEMKLALLLNVIDPQNGWLSDDDFKAILNVDNDTTSKRKSNKGKFLRHTHAMMARNDTAQHNSTK